MEFEKIRLLAIVPNEQIQTIMHEIQTKYTDSYHAHLNKDDNSKLLEIDTYVGNLYQGVELVKTYQNRGYDAIIARGETASMIKKASHLPVLEIQHTFYDVLHAVKLAETFQEPYAVLGFSSITSCAHRLRDLMQMDFDIYTLCSANEAPSMVAELKSKGYHLVISGMSVDYIIRRYGLKTVLVSSSYDSIESVIKQAIHLCSAYVSAKNELHFLSSVIRNSTASVIVYDEQQIPVFQSLQDMDEDLALSFAQRELGNMDSEEHNLTKIRGNHLYRIQKKLIKASGKTYTAFYIDKQKTQISSIKNELLYYTATEASDIFLKHFNELFPTGYESDYSMNQMIDSPLPIFFLGEQGTGKEQIAAYIFTQSHLKSQTFVIVDFKLIGEKTWTYLCTNVNSPLNDNRTTIFFRNLDQVSAARLEQLSAMIRDTNLCGRNRVFFSYSCINGTMLPDSIIQLIHKFSCISIRLTPLRERRDAFPSLTGLYISTLNSDYLKQVIGLSPEAMDLLVQYSWPGNLTQFKRVLTQLISTSYTSYIQKENVKRVLAEEEKNYMTQSVFSHQITLEKPLAEIQKDIIKAVLAETNGNQTKAAARLGICRTTLWKLLKT